MKQNKMLQSGRSMVEILGVLAVVGVLSIGGIMGYSYGMDKYRATETINELTLRAMSLMPQIRQGKIVELNMEMGETTSLGYSVDAWIDEDDPRYFYIALANVPSDVCRHILKQNWTLPTQIYMGDAGFTGNSHICGTGIAQQIDFEFYRDFGHLGWEKDNWDEYEMTPPLEVTPHPETCSDPNKPLMDTYGICYSCDTTDKVQVGGRGKCQTVCDNRVKVSYDCVLPCTSDKPLMDARGDCHACSETGDIVVGGNGQCSEVCGNRMKDGWYCIIK